MTNIEEQNIAGKQLTNEADFGDLVELTLKENRHYYAIHDKNGITICFDKQGKQGSYNEWGICHIAGYYGGVKDKNLRTSETPILSDGKIIPAFMVHDFNDADNVENMLVCLDPTMHKKEALTALQYAGAGHVKIPLTAIASYEIISTKRRGLRGVN